VKTLVHLPGRVWIALLLGACLVAGFWLRARHLGELGLIADEGIQALAVRGILEHGVPIVDSGQVYSRGLAFLYAEAAAARLFGLSEFSLRLPAVLFGIAGILAAYALGTAVFNWRIGLLTAVLMACSTWEIELSRYARFYTAFQCLYLVALLCFYHGFLMGHRAARWWFILAALATLSMHELGVLLATCFLIPLFSSAYSRWHKWALSLGAIGVVGLRLLYDRFVGLLKLLAGPVPEAQEVGASGLAASAIEATTGIAGVVQRSAAMSLLQAHPIQFMGLALIPLLASAALIRRGVATGDIWRTVLALPMVWVACFHQFGLVLVLWLFYVACCAKGVRDFLEPTLKVVYGAVGACLLFWIPALASDPSVPSLPRLLKLLFGYPNFYHYFLSWFLKGWPVLLGVFVVGSAWLGARFLEHRADRAALFTLGAIFIPALLASFSTPPFFHSRYVFHLYPLMLMVFAFVAIEVGARLMRRIPTGSSLGWRGTVMITLAALFVSQDAIPSRAWAVGSRTYQTPRDPFRASGGLHLYGGFHQDHKTPGLYVRQQLRPEDRVVAIGLPHKVALYHYYAGRVDYAVEERVKPFQLRLNDGEIIEHVTGSKLITSVSALQSLIEMTSSGDIWLLGDRIAISPRPPMYSSPMKALVRSLTRDPDYLGLDGQTFAVKIPRKRLSF
jgi:hypothetical protein